MGYSTRLTNNTDEASFQELLSKDNIFKIPYFQRRYKWKTDKLKRLHENILEVIDDEAASHFFGAIIIYSINTKPSEPDIYNIIDGQQRITTIFLYLLAGIIELSEFDEKSAVKYFKKFISIEETEGVESNLKLHPCLEDRMEINTVVQEYINNGKLKDILGENKPKEFTHYTKTHKGRIINNFRYAKTFYEKIRKEFGEEYIERVIECILSSFSVVQIDVKDPISGPKIFDSLNSKQEPMTIGDLVRNGIFSIKHFEDGEKMKELNKYYWMPFYERFSYNEKNYFDGYFFPYGLIKNPNLKKSEVYNYLQKDWSDRNLSPEEVIEELGEYQDPYMLIATGDRGYGNNIEDDVLDKVKDFKLINVPTSSYPYLMKVIREYIIHKIAKSNILEIFNVLESFFVRRMVCGIEPTGLHAVFKRLWHDTKGNVSVENIIDKIKSHKTVLWPEDEHFRNCIVKGSLYNNAGKYILYKYNKHLGGDLPSSKFEMEHVLPQEFNNEYWKERFAESDHKTLKDNIGNILPISKSMNAQIKNSGYDKKRGVYKNDSMFKMTREVADKYSDWNKDVIKERAEEIADWAIKKWIY